MAALWKLPPPQTAQSKGGSGSQLATDAPPHLVFCVKQPDHVDVWRVLQGGRDFPSWWSGTDLVA
jgi:plasmid stabilization system protein ParE